MRILLIEDDSKTVDLLRAGLAPEGYDIGVAEEGRHGLLEAASGAFDLLIVDRMLPGLDGLGLVRTLRAANIHTPVLFLTALSGIDDRVEGLRAGGDDYLVKPFALAELNARVAALLRRNAIIRQTRTLWVADLELDRLAQEVRRSGLKIKLKPREFKLLEYLMLHAGHVVTRTMLLEEVWGFHFEPRTSVVESHVSRVRAKINRAAEPDLIETVRGSGYRMTAAGA
jgi:two-component system OmpR family response regulator